MHVHGQQSTNLFERFNCLTGVSATREMNRSLKAERFVRLRKPTDNRFESRASKL
jgi:hypothetical protein